MKDKTLKKKTLKERFESIVQEYVEVFEAKHNIELDHWAGDEIGGVGCFGDYFFSFYDIKTDIDNDVDVKLIYEWYDENLEAGIGNTINYYSFIKGLRISHLPKKYTSEQQIEFYKNVCRLAEVPEFIIEHPEIVRGKTPDKDDIEWAARAIKEHFNDIANGRD